MVYTWTNETPVGRLFLGGDGESLQFLLFDSDRNLQRPPLSELGQDDSDWHESPDSFGETIRQLDAYFAGELRTFDLPLLPPGTEFQQEVWSALCTIPYGATVTYGKIAAQIGRPRASRAVGLANGSNPISIVIPCHRVIGSNGKLTGYGGGLERKQTLLQLEAPRPQQLSFL